MLSIITCFTFWLPCVSGEKIGLGLTSFVAFSVFMLMVAEKVNIYINNKLICLFF
jgi:nicotinic acetylcholine receptor, invertebrate